MTALVDSHNKSFSQTWDAQSNLATTQDPLAHGQVLAYDSLNRLTQTTLADSLVESQTYGPDDTVLSQTDAKGVTTTQTPNGFGEVVTRNSPDAGTLQFTRDANGNVLTRSDARGVSLTTTFDSLNRPLTQVGSTAGPAEQITWAYDTCANGVGHLCSVTDRTGSTAFTYDRWGRVASKTETVFGKSLTVGYAYNSVGELATITYPSGQVLTQTWAHGQVVNQQWGTGVGSGPAIFTAAQYDAWGKVQGWTWGSGRGFSLSYDQDGRVNAIGAGAGAASQTYSYDDAWRLTGITRQPANQTTTFGYDNRDRLTSGTTWGSYTYDGNSNRLSWLGTLGPQSFTYGPSTNTLASWNGIATTTDAAGNLLNPSGLTLTYDDWNRLRTATPSGGSLVTYGVNGLNERVASQQGTTQRIYLYASVGHLLGVYDGATGLPVEELAYLGERPVATVRANQVDPIETDHLMAPLRVLDPSNTVLWSWEDREPFGGSAPTSPSGFVLDLRFPGQWADETTGLVSNGFRDYDPAEGRYVQIDPLGIEADWNSYGYVGENAETKIDSTGLTPLLTNSSSTPVKDMTSGIRDFYVTAYTLMKDPEMRPLMNEILFGDKVYNIELSSSTNIRNVDYTDYENSRIVWNPRMAAKICYGVMTGYMSPMIAFGHEADHLVNHYSFQPFNAIRNTLMLIKATVYGENIGRDYDDKPEEYRVINGSERSAQYTFFEPIRNNHKVIGTAIVSDPRSNNPIGE